MRNVIRMYGYRIPDFFYDIIFYFSNSEVRYIRQNVLWYRCEISANWSTSAWVNNSLTVRSRTHVSKSTCFECRLPNRMNAIANTRGYQKPVPCLLFSVGKRPLNGKVSMFNSGTIHALLDSRVNANFCENR